MGGWLCTDFDFIDDAQGNVQRLVCVVVETLGKNTHYQYVIFKLAHYSTTYIHPALGFGDNR